MKPLEVLLSHKKGKDYITVIKGLKRGDAEKGAAWLQGFVDELKRQYDAFVRTRQAATQSYEGYDEIINRQRLHIAKALESVDELMASQGSMLETMAVTELTARRERLADFTIKARFAMAENYDRATRATRDEGE